MPFLEEGGLFIVLCLFDKSSEYALPSFLFIFHMFISPLRICIAFIFIQFSPVYFHTECSKLFIQPFFCSDIIEHQKISIDRKFSILFLSKSSKSCKYILSAGLKSNLCQHKTTERFLGRKRTDNSQNTLTIHF